MVGPTAAVLALMLLALLMTPGNPIGAALRSGDIPAVLLLWLAPLGALAASGVWRLLRRRAGQGETARSD